MRLPVKTALLDITLSGGTATENGTQPQAGTVGIVRIAGPDVMVRALADSDPVLGRILKNENLLRTVYEGHVCYVPKQPVEGIINSWKDVYIAGYVVWDGTSDTDAAIADATRNVPRNVACQQWYRRLRLPVLITYLAILLANVLYFPSINRRCEERRRQTEASQRQNRVQTAVTERQKQLIHDFPGTSAEGMSYSFDKMAAAVPSGVRLVLLSASQDGFCIKGETTEITSVLSYVKNLEADFGDARLRAFDKVPGKEVMRFELQVKQ